LLFICALISLFGGSTALTAWALSYGSRHRILDLPQARSSHTVPTPRGGGAGLVITFLMFVLFAGWRAVIDARLAAALVGGGFAVALTGALDDRFKLPARFRIAIHFLASIWALWMLRGAPPLYLGWAVWNWGWIGDLVCLIGIAWMINLYNFMDGIDGLAGLEAICASMLSALLLARSGLEGLSQSALMLAAASAGFLVWNWSPAKVFMGDVGSGFLGFVFGVLAVSSAKQRPWLLWPWLILLSVFIVDASLTLMRRLVSGKQWYQAHRSHAYQHAAKRWGSHSKVTLMIAAVNAAWLFPLAWGACIWPAAGSLFALVAIVPLVYTASRYDAGREAPAAEVTLSAEEQEPYARLTAFEGDDAESGKFAAKAGR
jgi:Fuc2NAc and GlcNAc transferase